MDDETPPVDAIGPWTIKAVPTETRNKVTIAARKEGLTVGQWLERRVNEWLDDGGPVRVSHGQPASQPKSAAAVDDLCRLTEAAARLAETADRMPKLLRAGLTRTLREALPPAKPRQPPQRAISHTPAVEA